MGRRNPGILASNAASGGRRSTMERRRRVRHIAPPSRSVSVLVEALSDSYLAFVPWLHTRFMISLLTGNRCNSCRLPLTLSRIRSRMNHHTSASTPPIPWSV